MSRDVTFNEFDMIQEVLDSSKRIDASSEASKQKTQMEVELIISPSTSIQSLVENQECSSVDEPIIVEESTSSP